MLPFYQNQASDLGPAPKQVTCDDISGKTSSTVTLPEQSLDLKQQIQNTVKSLVLENKKSTRAIIPWLSHTETPRSEFTSKYFFNSSFPFYFFHV